MVRAKKKRREMTNVTHPISRHISYTKYTTSSSSLKRYSAAVVPAPETNLITGAFTRCFLIPPPFSEFEVVATPKHQLPTPNERRKNFTWLCISRHSSLYYEQMIPLIFFALFHLFLVYFIPFPPNASSLIPLKYVINHYCRQPPLLIMVQLGHFGPTVHHLDRSLSTNRLSNNKCHLLLLHIYAN